MQSGRKLVAGIVGLQDPFLRGREDAGALALIGLARERGGFVNGNNGRRRGEGAPRQGGGATDGQGRERGGSGERWRERGRWGDCGGCRLRVNGS